MTNQLTDEAAVEPGESLEQYADRIVAAARKIMLERLDDDVIGRLGDSHLIFGKMCAMEAVTTAMREMGEKIEAEREGPSIAAQLTAATRHAELVKGQYKLHVQWSADTIGKLEERAEQADRMLAEERAVLTRARDYMLRAAAGRRYVGWRDAAQSIAWEISSVLEAGTIRSAASGEQG